MAQVFEDNLILTKCSFYIHKPRISFSSQTDTSQAKSFEPKIG